MTKEMTKGSPMRLILGFALPTLLGLLFQQLYNVVDTMIDRFLHWHLQRLRHPGGPAVRRRRS